MSSSMSTSCWFQMGDHLGWELFIEGQRTDAFTFDADLSQTGEVGRYRYLWEGRNAKVNVCHQASTTIL